MLLSRTLSDAFGLSALAARALGLSLKTSLSAPAPDLTLPATAPATALAPLATACPPTVAACLPVATVRSTASPGVGMTLLPPISLPDAAIGPAVPPSFAPCAAMPVCRRIDVPRFLTFSQSPFLTASIKPGTFFAASLIIVAENPSWINLEIAGIPIDLPTAPMPSVVAIIRALVGVVRPLAKSAAARMPPCSCPGNAAPKLIIASSVGLFGREASVRVSYPKALPIALSRNGATICSIMVGLTAVMTLPVVCTGGGGVAVYFEGSLYWRPVRTLRGDIPTPGRVGPPTWSCRPGGTTQPFGCDTDRPGRKPRLAPPDAPT